MGPDEEQLTSLMYAIVLFCCITCKNVQNMKPVQFCTGFIFIHFARLYTFCSISHIIRILYILCNCTHFVQICTGFINCTFLAVVHILYNFAQISHFVHFAQLYTCCAILYRFHIFHILRSCTHYVEFCTGFIFSTFCAVVHFLHNFAQV